MATFKELNDKLKELLEGEKDTSRVEKFGALKSAVDELEKSQNEMNEKHAKLISDYLALSSKIQFPSKDTNDGSPSVFNEDDALKKIFEEKEKK